MDEEANKAGFLVASPEKLYYRQLTHTIAIFIERSKENFVCYRLKWEYESVAGIQRIKDEKFYCRGPWRQCLGKARRIVKFWETEILTK